LSHLSLETTKAKKPNPKAEKELKKGFQTMPKKPCRTNSGDFLITGKVAGNTVAGKDLTGKDRGSRPSTLPPQQRRNPP